MSHTRPSVSDLDTIRERHVVCDHCDNIVGHCDGCGRPWPCDTRVVLDDFDVLLANGPEYYEALLANARADADRLAGALRAVLGGMEPGGHPERIPWSIARDSLRQHDDLTKEV